MNDKYDDLVKIFQSSIKTIEKADYEKLKEICERENLEYDGLSEEELRNALIDYFNEEIQD